MGLYRSCQVPHPLVVGTGMGKVQQQWGWLYSETC